MTSKIEIYHIWTIITKNIIILQICVISWKFVKNGDISAELVL